MSIKAAKQISFNFVSDGASTAVTFDLTQPPNSFNFSGLLPSAVADLTVTNTQSVTVPTVAPTFEGTQLTLTFNTPPPQLDGNSALVIYTVTFYLEF